MSREHRQTLGMRGAAVIQFGSKYTSLGAQLLTTAVLARLISPDEFGVLAIVVVFLTFFSMFSDMGVSSAIVQYQDLSESDIGALFVFSCFLAVVLAGSFCAVSPFIAMIYGNEELVNLCCLASLALLCTTLNMVPNGLLLQNKDFISMGIRLLVTTIVSGGLAILLAFEGWGCYALVFQYVIQGIAVLVWNLTRRPIKCLNIHVAKPLKRIFAYSAFQFGFGIINYFARNLDNMLIGKIMGTTLLGYYDKAYKLTTYPMNAISSVVASVIQPYMAEHQNEPDIIFSSWIRVEKLISLLAAPIASLFICAAPEIILIMYGEQWDMSIPLFRVLAVSVYFQMMNNTAGAYFQSLGKTNLLFLSAIINSAITTIAIVCGIATNDLVLTSTFVTIAYCLHTVTNSLLLIKFSFGESLRRLSVFLPEILLGIAACLTCRAVEMLLPQLGVFDVAWKALVIMLVIAVGYKASGQFMLASEALHGSR